MPGSTAVCHESGYLLSPPSHLHAFQWLPLLIDSLLPLAHQPASFLFIFSSTVLHFIVFFRGDITSVVIIISLFFSFPLNKLFTYSLGLVFYLRLSSTLHRLYSHPQGPAKVFINSLIHTFFLALSFCVHSCL